VVPLNEFRKFLQELEQRGRFRGIPLHRLVLEPIKQQLMFKPVGKEGSSLNRVGKPGL
jgi:hypothetical protein